MNQLMNIATQQNLVMNSKEVTDYLNMFNDEAGIETRFRHDKVKQSIERLVKQGVVHNPPLGDCGRINSLGLTQKETFYVFEGEQGKRDCITLVAQLSPLHTSRIVDRWIELEQQKPELPTTYIDALECLLEAKKSEARLIEQNQVLEEEITEVSSNHVAIVQSEQFLKGEVTLRNFFKTYTHLKPKAAKAILCGAGVFTQSSKSIPYQKYMDAEWFFYRDLGFRDLSLVFTAKGAALCKMICNGMTVKEANATYRRASKEVITEIDERNHEPARQQAKEVIW